MNAFPLDVIGALEGTDKSSSHQIGWDYLRHYESMFAGWREKAINLIEIGVETGASLRVWKAFFPKATIVGVDVHRDCARFAEDRIVIEIGSQADPGHLHRICTKYPPTIFIDDGSHLAHHMIYTFEHAFPTLLPGGLYIIEDIAFHYGSSARDSQGESGISIPDYLWSLATASLARRQDQDWGSARYAFDNIDSISFIRSAAIIKKKAEFDVTTALQSAREYLNATDETAEKWGRLAAFILRHNGPIDDARAAIERSGNQAGALVTLAEILDRQGCLDEAASTLRKACELHPSDEGIWRRRGRLEGRLQHFDLAAAAFEYAVTLRPKEPIIRHELATAYEGMGNLDNALAAAVESVTLSQGDPAHERFARNAARLEVLIKNRQTGSVRQSLGSPRPTRPSADPIGP